VLVVSTDPAHSLGDAFGAPLTATPHRMAARLDAVELDARRAFARWVRQHHEALADLVERGTWLDRGDAESLLALPVPGVDELAGILEIARLARAAPSRYDLVIVDMAPTGHALRFIAAPRTVAAVADVLDALQQQHRIVRERFGRPHIDAADELIETLAGEAEAMAAMLRDPATTTFAWVTLAERMSLAESEDGIAALTAEQIPVSELIVNRVSIDGRGCAVCTARASEDAEAAGEIIRSLGRGRRTRIVPALTEEPRGTRGLRRLSRYLGGRQTAPLASSHRRRSPRRPVMSSAPGRASIAPETVPAIRDARLLFVGGKGGVGKTTVAAALALRIAADRPDRSILLLSTDPAHSVADVLRAPIGAAPALIPGGPTNLYACELDAARAFREKRRAIEAALEQLGSLDAGIRHLLELTPPGVDELFGMMALLDVHAGYHVTVVDTAPTGHALRLLALPEAAQEWVRVLMRLLLKYRDLIRPGSLGAELLDASRLIRRLQEAVRDPRSSRFLVVTRAARLPRAETVRLLSSLRQLKLAPGAVVFNARTLAPGRCPRCRAIAGAERRQIAALRPPRDCVIIQTPLVVPPPQGRAALNRWTRAWTADRS
jgi:arsenite-transporting ATPase